MPSTSSLLAAAILPLLALCTSETSHARFTVPRIPTNHTKSPVQAHHHTFHQYKVPPPSYKPRPNDGSVHANPQQYDSSYLSPVKIGSETLMLDFDTGSSDLWVFSTLLPKNKTTTTSKTKPHNLYNPHNSGTLQPKTTWSILYGDGTGAEGVVYSDHITIGGATVTSQAIEAATSVASRFVRQTGDGFLGLGFPDGNTCSPSPCPTFFENLTNSTDQPVFTADLQPEGGSYDFGFVDEKKYVGGIEYVDVLHRSPAYWDFRAGNFSIVGSSHNKSSAGSESYHVGYSIMDTGTSNWYLPESATKAFYAAIPGAFYDEDQGAYVYPCKLTPPDVEVEIGGRMMRVPGSAMNFGSAEDGSENCIGGIQYSGLLPGSIFGDTFMKEFFVVFDQGRERIGVARQK